MCVLHSYRDSKHINYVYITQPPSVTANKLFVHSTVFCNQTVKRFELPNALPKFFIIMFIVKKDWLVKK